MKNKPDEKISKSAGRGKVRYSLRAEFTLLFAVLIAGTILGGIFINTVMLERFYIREKQNALTQMYETLSQAAVDGRLQAREFDLELITLTSRNDIGVSVMDAQSKTIQSYASDSETMEHRMWDNLLEYDSEYDEVEDILESPAKDQTLQKVLDLRTNTEYLELWGILPDGSFYLLRTALESIRNSSRIANRFLIYVGIFSALIGAAAAFLLAARITRPILELTDIARRMRELDFSARYTGNDRTEIADLGHDINELSESLKNTISDLKNANYRLQQDIEERERVDRVQREFISGVTHELKTPIALIRGYAEGLEAVAEEPESRSYYLEVIRDEADRMNDMVRKMLDLSRLEEGADNISYEWFNLSELILGAAADSVRQAQNDGIHILLPAEDLKIYVWADAFLAEQVFLNYFSNALHYCEEVNGQKEIRVSFISKKDTVRIVVFNTGKKIPEDSLDRIWDRFYKVDKARSREYGGTGIGLSIVKACMDQLHRNYGVENVENGVEFWFELDNNRLKDQDPIIDDSINSEMNKNRSVDG